MRHNVNAIRASASNQRDRNDARHNRDCNSEKCHKSASPNRGHQNRGKRQKRSRNCVERKIKRNQNHKRDERNQAEQIAYHKFRGVVAQNRVAKKSRLKIVPFDFFVSNFADFIQKRDLLFLIQRRIQSGGNLRRRKSVVNNEAIVQILPIADFFF